MKIALFFGVRTFLGDRCATIVPLDDQEEEGKKCKWNTLEVGFPVHQQHYTTGMSANELLSIARRMLEEVKLDLLI